MTKTHARAALLATTAALTIIANAGAAPNVVLNPGFETGVLAPEWIASCPSGVCSVQAGVGNPGAAFQGFNNNVVPGTLSQALVTAPGLYQIQFDYRNALVTPSNSLTAQFGGSAPIGTSLTDAYQTATAYVVTPTANTPLTFLYTTIPGSGTVRIDNVSVVMVDDGEGNNIAAASQTVAFQASREFLDRLHDRFSHSGSPIATASIGETVVADAASSTYINAGGKYRAFLSVFGSQGDWDDSSTEADRQGLSAGFEFVAGRGFDLGVAVSFSRAEFTTSTVFTANDGEADEYLGAIYAHWSAPSMPLYATGILGYGQSSNDFRRTSLVGLGAVFANEVDAEQWFASAEVGWDWMVSQRLTLTPFVRGDFANLDQDGYSEAPVGGALLVPAVVAGRDVDATRTIVGLRGEFDLDIGRGAKLGGKVGWAHDFDQDRFVTFTETTGPVSFAGIASAATPAEDSVVVGASFEIAVSERASFYAGYNGDIADEQDIHAGEVGLRVTW